jgi:hypothetical protein
MKREKIGSTIISRVGHIYNLNAITRSIVIWLGFQAVLWFVFGLSYLTHEGAWLNVLEVEPSTAAEGSWWSTFFYIVINNFIICLLIIIGNLFVRFSIITPGLLILVIQAIMIGWLAGANGFEVPFVSVKAANMQYLKIGLWETTAYALVCAVTLPKSLLIADTFPAKKWSQKRKLKDIKLSFTEICILLLSGIVLITATAIETFAII